MKKESAFTFIELIIAVTIFSIIAVSIYSTFHAGLKIWLKTSPMIEENQRYRIFFDTIALDLKNAVNYYDQSKSLMTQSGFGQSSGERMNFEGKSDRASFMTVIKASGADSAPGEELARVAYIYDRSTRSLKRLVAAKDEGFDEDKAKTYEMLSGVDEKSFGFEYCYKKPITNTEYEYEWEDAWEDENAKNIPRGVRIKAAGFEKTVFIPSGVLGEEK